MLKFTTMKKIFVIIGLLVSLVSFSQDDTFIVNLTLTGDTIIKYNPRVSWFGKVVSVDVSFKYPEDNTGIISIGGADGDVTKKIGTYAFKSYLGWDNNPLTVDTTGTVIKQLGSNLWWGVGYSCVNGWPYKDCAIQWDANTCDDVQAYIKFKVIW